MKTNVPARTLPIVLALAFFAQLGLAQTPTTDVSTANHICTEQAAIARLKLGHRVAFIVRHPDISAVKCQRERASAHGKGAQLEAIARAQFR